MKFVIPVVNQQSYNFNHPRNKDLKLDITNNCNWPSRVLVVDHAGNCFVCQCEAWLPIKVGHITEFNRLEHIWSSPIAVALQEDVSSKKFSHCAVYRCGILNGNNMLDEYVIYINIDPSCNLVCPSCRKDSIMYNSGPEYERRLSEVNHLVTMLEQFDQPTRIIMTGNGDPLASAIMRPLIQEFRPKENQRVKLFTNALLLEKQLQDSTIFKHIDQYQISVDAGSKDVYENVRRPGKFDMLLKNLSWLQQQGRTAELNFVLQLANWHDLENFFLLCQQFGFSGNVTRLENWGTWDDYDEQDVIGNDEHPDHLLALQELRRVYKIYKDDALWGASLLRVI